MSVRSGVRALLKFMRKERNRERKWMNFRNRDGGREGESRRGRDDEMEGDEG